MKHFLFLVIAPYFLFAYLVTGDPCPFNANCNCDLSKHFAECKNMATFPTFSHFNETAILMIIINGNFTSIPAKAFYSLQSLYSAYVYIQRALEYANIPLAIDDSAFVTFNKYAISLLELDYFQFSTIPTKPLSLLTCDQFSITYGTLENVTANAFTALTTGEIAVYQNGLKFIDPDAFNGLQITGTNGLILSFGYNSLTEISTAFKTINASAIYLFYNHITQVPDYAFSSCNTPSGCSNALGSLYLSNNPITSIGDNAFANLPNLLELDFSQMNLSAVPVNAMRAVASSLQIIDLTYNMITTVEANSFYGFNKLTSIVLNWNPITTIELGAFNGVPKVLTLSFSGLLNLTTVDLLITYGMGMVNNLEFNYCPKLSNIILSDASKLPPTLETITFSLMTNISSVDRNLQTWLKSDSSKTLDISNNHYFNCNPGVSWMANYALCPPYQIVANGTMCANTNEALFDYLANYHSPCL